MKIPISYVDVFVFVAYTSDVSDSKNLENQSDPQSMEPSLNSQKKQSSNLTIIVLFLAIAVLIGFIVGKSNPPKTDTSSSLVATKQAELDASIAATNQKRELLGLPPLQGFGSEEGEKIAARLTRDAISLASYLESFRSQILEKDKYNDKLKEELIASEQTRAALTSQIAKLQLKVDSISTLPDFKTELEERLRVADSQITSLKQQLMQAASAVLPSNDELSKAKEKILDLEAQLGAIQSLNTPTLTENPTTHKLFANSDSELLLETKAFFQALGQLEDKAGSAVNQLYNSLAQQHKASFMSTIQFDTGSFTLKPSEQAALTSAIAKLPDNAVILIVGYASTTGDPAHNRTLSSNRAQECALLANKTKQTNQKVQAVYYGQTKRFSERNPEQNQICEVWAIVP